MTPRLVFLLCVFLGLALWAESQEMPEACWRRGALRHAVVGVSVKRVSDGKDVCAFHAETALRPASVAKLIPAALALKAKGPSFAYVTRVGLTGEVRDGVLRGDLLVRAGGDPALDSRYFPSAAFLQRVVDTLAALGVREIEGRVRVEETSCDAAIPGSWLWEDVANYYGALCHGFNYRDNLYTLTFRSGEVGDTARLVGVEPSLPGVRFETRVTASSRNADNVWIYGGPDASVLRVRGTMPARRKAFAVKGAIHHPARVFESELTRRLAGNGIAVRNGIPENTSGARLLLEHRSPALAEIVRFTNKRSVNLFAEALGRLVASEDWEREAKRALSSVGVDTSGVVLKDACGLSAFNALPAAALTDLLVWAARHLDAAFHDSLPICGADGGLRPYASAEELRRNLRAKTGSMAATRSLAGYLTAASGDTYAFAVIVNNYACSPSEVQAVIRDFLAWGYRNW